MLAIVRAMGLPRSQLSIVTTRTGPAEEPRTLLVADDPRPESLAAKPHAASTSGPTATRPSRAGSRTGAPARACRSASTAFPRKASTDSGPQSFSPRVFREDPAQARAVIANAGLQLLGEAAALRNVSRAADARQSAGAERVPSRRSAGQTAATRRSRPRCFLFRLEDDEQRSRATRGQEHRRTFATSRRLRDLARDIALARVENDTKQRVADADREHSGCILLPEPTVAAPPSLADRRWKESLGEPSRRRRSIPMRSKPPCASSSSSSLRRAEGRACARSTGSLSLALCAAAAPTARSSGARMDCPRRLSLGAVARAPREGGRALPRRPGPRSLGEPGWGIPAPLRRHPDPPLCPSSPSGRRARAWPRKGYRLGRAEPL